MKDGYYLSTYLYSDKLAYVMDIKMRHNQNLSLWKKTGNDVTLVHFWELERLSGLKQHSTSFFDEEELEEIILELLKPYGLVLEDIVEIWGTPSIDTDNYLNYSSMAQYSHISYHSIAHLFSCLLFNSRNFYQDTIIGLSVDSGPDNVVEKDAYEKNLYAGSIVKNGDIDVFSIKSPGKLWSRAKKVFDMREGTLMALATASTSKLLNFDDYKFEMRDFSAREEAKKFFEKLENIIDNIKESDTGILFNGYDKRFTERENKISMAMKVVQKFSNQIMEENIDNVIKKYNINPKETILALAGGYALNCPTNSYLMEKYQFKDFVAPPCVNDSGMSLGIGMYSFYKKSEGQKINIDINHPYYGDKDDSLNELIDADLYKNYINKISKCDYNQVVQDIIKEPIVWFNGSSEIGPRALGNRSILGDPRFDTTKDRLNVVKDREWWRPVAPIILEEDGNEYFKNFRPSPFMLQNFDLRFDKLNIVPAIAHLDGTSRVQSITKNTNPELYNLLVSFKLNTGIPIICNTSLNDKGEPIINTIKEAFNFALRKNFSVIYINGIRIELKNHKLYHKKEVFARKLIGTKDISENQKSIIRKKLNPHSLSQEVLIYYYDHSSFKEELDITVKEDAEKLELVAREYIDKYPLSFVRS